MTVSCVFVVYIWFMYDFDFFFFKQKTAYEMRISDWSSDVCSSDLEAASIETEIRFEQGVQALQQQAASGQQGKRRGNLECDQPPAQSGAPAPRDRKSVG